MTPAIELVDVTKRFGRTRALDGLTMSVEPGQVHGFLGPNGAGKSTTIRVLLGLIQATSGRARLLGEDPWTHAATLHRRLAYVPGDVNLWPNLTGGQAIDVLSRTRGAVDPARRRELLEAFDLDPTKRGRSYSKGNRQKVALVAALCGEAELLVLDEPTSGLDPLMERVFAEQIRAEAERGRTVLLSSHVLSEVEALCSHVSIIAEGRLVETGTLASLRHLHRVRLVAELDAVPDRIAELDGLHDVEASGHRLAATVDPARLGAVMRVLGDSGVRTLTTTPPTLEELFLGHYQRAGGARR